MSEVGGIKSINFILQELAGLLAEPLQARFSRRFFTGAPTADHHLRQDELSPHADLETGIIEEACDEDVDSAEAQFTRAPVELAQRLADSRAAAATSKVLDLPSDILQGGLELIKATPQMPAACKSVICVSKLRV